LRFNETKGRLDSNGRIDRATTLSENLETGFSGQGIGSDDHRYRLFHRRNICETVYSKNDEKE
jgi:hypothetical protein